jgi:hypothetical protein
MAGEHVGKNCKFSVLKSNVVGGVSKDTGLQERFLPWRE